MWSLIFIPWHLSNFKLVHVDIIDFTVRECEINNYSSALVFLNK